MTLKVLPARTRADIETFVRLPERLYADDPNWVPPLRREVRKTLDVERNPFLQRAETRPFLAFRGDRPVGRIVATWDPLFVEARGERLGWFGFFECEEDPEAAAALVRASEDFAREKGAVALRGPASLSMNDECGLLVEGFDRPPVLMTPYNPSHYAPLLEGAGLAKAKDLLAFRRSLDVQIPEALTRLAERARSRYGISTRPVDAKHLGRDRDLIRSIYNESWRGNWGTPPLTEPEMAEAADLVVSIAPPEFIRLGFVNGEPAGVSITLPDLNPALRMFRGRMTPWGLLGFVRERRRCRGARQYITGVKERFRNRGLELLFWIEAEAAGRRLGYEWVELSWILEDNAPTVAMAEIMGAPIRRFRIFEKTLA
jgi:hypothetical protein